ncbi:Clavaminate synthase-like protein [Poronia punctata]|nr:Clavaminate synthase-like protein [Poronia punctata]
MAGNPDLVKLPRAPTTSSGLKYAETYIVDLALDDGGEGTRQLVQTIKRSATTGIFHIVNHGIPMDLIELQRDVAYTYFSKTSLEQKDNDTTNNASGVFEGYKLRTPEEKESGLIPTIEEYNYDFYATGKVKRPPIMDKYEAEMSSIYSHYHNVLIPKIMKLLSIACDKESDHFYKMHDPSQPNSEIGHYLRYHTNWTRDDDKKRASYAGHTDIGSVTFLYCNPVICLQVYAPEGWRYVQYIENSVIVNIGDCLESLTGGKFPAALHRLVRFQPDQGNYERLALVYFVHPHDDIIRQHFRLEQERRQTLRGTNMMSGQEVNRLIMALSADNEDPYAKILDENVFLRAKTGDLVPAPEQMTFDYDNRTILQSPSFSSFSEEQWTVLRNLAQAIAQSGIRFSERDWMSAMRVVNGEGEETTGEGKLSREQLDVLKRGLGLIRG